MSEQHAIVLSEADEQLLRRVRDELLGKLPGVSEPTAEVAARSGTPRWLQALAIAIGMLAALLSILEWWDPQSFQGCKLWAGILLMFLFAGWLWARGKQQEAAKKQQSQPPPPTAFWPRLLNSILWFVLVGLVLFTPIDLMWLLAVIGFHEAGHYVGMVLFGYHDLKMFFIPGLGGAVQGEKKGVPAWQEAIMLLLGPVPGLVLGCCLYFVDQSVPLPPFLRAPPGW